MLVALGAGSPSSLGSLAALALVGRLLPLSSASGAGLLVSLRPATMIVVKFALDISIVESRRPGIAWYVQNSRIAGRKIIVCVQLILFTNLNYVPHEGLVFPS
jgi:hypothetical protein